MSSMGKQIEGELRRLDDKDPLMRMYDIAEGWKIQGFPWFKGDILKRELEKRIPDMKERSFYGRFRAFIDTEAIVEKIGGNQSIMGPWREIPPLLRGQNSHVYYMISDSVELGLPVCAVRPHLQK